MRALPRRGLPVLVTLSSLALAACVPPRASSPRPADLASGEGSRQQAARAEEKIERIHDQYEELPAAQRYAIATDRAVAAERAGQGVEAFAWREKALQSARTPAEREEAERALIETVESSLSAVEIQRLAEQGQDSSPATPILRFKLAKIFLHIQDWTNLDATLRDFLALYPNHPYAALAREYQERVKLRGIVSARKLGVVLPLSGKYESFGKQLLEGMRLALAGSSIELVVKDDAGDPARAAKLAEALVFEDHVIALAGGVLGAEAQAVALAAQKLGVPVISFSRAEDVTALGEYVFQDMLTNRQMAEALAAYAVESRGLKRFGVMYPELTYGEELAAAFRASVEDRGGQMAGEASYAQDQTTFSETIRAVVGEKVEGGAAYANCVAGARQISDPRRRKNALAKCKSNLAKVVPFDALFLPDRWQSVALVSAGLAFEDVITNWCDVKDIDRIERTTGNKVQPVVLLGANLWNHPDLPARAGKYVNCSVFVDGFWAGSTRPETAAFVGAFIAATGRAPGLLEAYGYDAAKVLRAALESSRAVDRDTLRDTLLALRDVPSAMGPTRVAPNRELVHPMFFLTVDHGTIRETDPTLRDGPP